MAIAQDEEVSRNLEAFNKMLPDILNDYYEKYALMRDERIVQFFDTWADADAAGEMHFEDGIYSIQWVSDRPIYNW